MDAAVAYDNPQTGETSVLLINQAIMIPSIKNILLCPMQCCLNGVTVNDVPKFLLKNPTVDDHVVIQLRILQQEFWHAVNRHTIKTALNRTQ